MAKILVGFSVILLMSCPTPGDSGTTTTYAVAYDGNGNTGGTVPADSNKYHQADTITVLGNTGILVKSGFTFAGWNTKADGSGTSYAGGATFSMGTANVMLYAVWTQNATYSVTYDPNGATGGGVPTDSNNYLQGATVTVLGNSGNLVKSGYSFAGWNTQANGGGTTYAAAATFTMGTSNVTLYALWGQTTRYFVYVAKTSGGVAAYSIGSNGALTQLTSLGSPFATGTSPIAVAVSPNSSFLYVANSGSGYGVSAYSIGSNGALTQLTSLGSPFATGQIPYGVAVSPNGSFLYVTNLFDNNISAYSIGSNGALTQLTSLGSPFAAGDYAPWRVAVSPNGSFLYVTDHGNHISAFSIGSNGALTQLTSLGSPFTTGNWPTGVAVSPNGSFLYAVNENNNIVSAYSIGSNGALTALTGSPFAAGTDPYAVAVSPDGSFLYVANYGSGNVSAYSIGSNGALTQLTSLGSPFAASNGAAGVAVSPNGTFLYVTYYLGGVAAYSIGSNGALTQLTSLGSPFGSGGAYGIAIATITGP